MYKYYTLISLCCLFLATTSTTLAQQVSFGNLQQIRVSNNSKYLGEIGNSHYMISSKYALEPDMAFWRLGQGEMLNMNGSFNLPKSLQVHRLDAHFNLEKSEYIDFSHIAGFIVNSYLDKVNQEIRIFCLLQQGKTRNAPSSLEVYSISLNDLSVKKRTSLPCTGVLPYFKSVFFSEDYQYIVGLSKNELSLFDNSLKLIETFEHDCTQNMIEDVYVNKIGEVFITYYKNTWLHLGKFSNGKKQEFSLPKHDLDIYKQGKIAPCPNGKSFWIVSLYGTVKQVTNHSLWLHDFVVNKKTGFKSRGVLSMKIAMSELTPEQVNFTPFEESIKIAATNDEKLEAEGIMCMRIMDIIPRNSSLTFGVEKIWDEPKVVNQNFVMKVLFGDLILFNISAENQTQTIFEKEYEQYNKYCHFMSYFLTPTEDGFLLGYNYYAGTLGQLGLRLMRLDSDFNVMSKQEVKTSHDYKVQFDILDPISLSDERIALLGLWRTNFRIGIISAE